MRTIFCLIIIALIWLPAPAPAEYYKYKDANGVIRYTDNLADIPADQRPKIETRKEAEDYLSPQERAEKARQDADKLQKEPKAADAKKKQQEPAAAVFSGSASPDQMKQTRDVLDKEHAGLMKAKQALEAERDTLRTADQVKLYQQKVTQLNERIAAYDKRREAFSKEVNAFNAKQGQAP